jgi:hypothetical protein
MVSQPVIPRQQTMHMRQVLRRQGLAPPGMGFEREVFS